MTSRTKRRPRRRSAADRSADAAAALARALADKSQANYGAIVEGFADRGIPVEEIRPRENVFTYQAWQAKGRQVRRGERGVKITAIVEKEETNRATGKLEKVRFTRGVTVFHETQTFPIGEEDDGETRPPPPTGASEDETGKPPTDSAKLAERFYNAADKLEAKIAHAERHNTQRYTARRHSFYRSRLHDADCMRETQKALRALALAHARGEVPPSVAMFRKVSDVADAMSLEAEHVSNGYHPYLSTKYGVYLDKSADAQALQQLVRDGGAHESDEQRQRRTEIENLETRVRGMKLPGFFPTPPKLAEVLVDLANIQPGDEVLEPSAGIVSLAQAIRDNNPTADLVCVEQNVDLIEVLRLKGFETIAGDFLRVEGQVNRIVMNPPYERRQDAEHVMHAYSLLAPGGRLVALTSVSLFQAEDAKCVVFREWFDDIGATRFATLEDAFNDSDAFRQTGVTVAVIIATT
jgi:hypothetical protein